MEPQPSKQKVDKPSFYEKRVPIAVRKNLTWVVLVGSVGWGLTSDTILSIYDVVSDYILADEHLR